MHLLFVANGRAIPQGGVPSGRIVEAFDEAEAGHACLDLRGKAASLEQFAFEGGKEALAQGVIVSVPDRFQLPTLSVCEFGACHDVGEA